MPDVSIPMRTVSGMNARENWRARARRVKHEREVTALYLTAQKRPELPVVVTLTRIAPSNGLDPDDNLPSAFKGIRDQIAAWLGVDDRDRATVRYEYEQRRGPWAVEISWRPK